LIENFKLKIKNFLLDTLFPISCLSCGQPDTWLCPSCLAKITTLTSQVCLYCEKITTPYGKICPRCREKHLERNLNTPMDALICATGYNSGNISQLIHLYKYNFVADLHIPLGKILAISIIQNNLPLPDVIIPIPLHPRRLRWRGFNQAELLADYLSENLAPGLKIPVNAELLKRKSYTTPQMKIKNYKERQKNIKDAFGFRVRNKKDYSLRDKNILLIDDVATTGATLFECAKILKENGAKNVFGAVIARQEMK